MKSGTVNRAGISIAGELDRLTVMASITSSIFTLVLVQKDLKASVNTLRSNSQQGVILLKKDIVTLVQCIFSIRYVS